MTQPWLDFNFFIIDPVALRPNVAISACLNGERVRYDGSDKHLKTVSTFLCKHLNLLPICPEVGAGMSVPRPPIQLQRTAEKTKALGRDDASLDMTTALTDYARNSMAPLTDTLHGYIFKSRSPSCGVGTTPVYDESGLEEGLSSGLQAAYVQDHLPWLPLRQETELQQQAECVFFIWHCLIMADLRQACRNQQLANCHQHYQPIWQQFGRQTQDHLEQGLLADQQLTYCQVFNTALSQSRPVFQNVL